MPRLLLSALLCLLVAAPAAAQPVPAAAPERVANRAAPSRIERANRAALGAVWFNFWDQDGDHLRVPGDGGIVGHGKLGANLWMTAQMMDVLYHQAVALHDPEARSRFVSAWNWIAGRLGHGATGHGLRSVDAAPDGNIGFSDDAVWIFNLLVQAAELAGDTEARDDTLDDALALWPAVLDKFRDPALASVRLPGGELRASPEGIYYALGSGTGHDRRSSSYEIMAGATALQVYRLTGREAYRHYALFTYDLGRRRFLSPRGLMWTELDLDPGHTVPQGCDGPYLHPIQRCYGPPRRGNAAEYDGGTQAWMVLCARLYRLTHEDRYRADALRALDAYGSTTGFLRRGNTAGGVTGDKFVNARDPWTDAYWMPYVAEEVLTLPGADPRGTFRSALRATALSIRRQMTPEGYLGADWTGPEVQDQNRPADNDNADGHANYDNYVDQGGGPGSTNQAEPEQMQTTAQGALMVTSAAIAEAAAH